MFHSKIKNMCDAHNKNYYKDFSKYCDEYFYLPHRKEARGDGGIFYDYLETSSWEGDFNFTMDVGSCFLDVVSGIITMDMNKKWKKEHKEQQKIKRGRYAEFNLLYDRGTKFGLQTDGNIDAILMSMPPEAKWI
jgi:coproporphyrinogen III oxidase